MKKFLLRVALFMLPIAALLVLFDIGQSRIATTVGAKKVYFEKQLSQWEILILGSSHAYRGINPHLLPRLAFNLAAPGQSLYFDSKILLKYLPRMQKLQTVVFTVSFRSFEYSTSDNSEYWRKFFYYRYYGLSEKRDLPILDLRNFSWFAFYGNKTSLDHLRHLFRVSLTGPMDKHGWIGGAPNTETEFNALGADGAKRRMDYQLSILKPSFIPRNAAALEEALAALKERNIQAVIVVTPVYQEYSKITPSEKRDRMWQELHKLNEKFGVSILNYTDDPRFVTKDFLNNDHLNEQGAEKLTRFLNSELFESK